MVAAFVAIGTATMGFLGAFRHQFCMIMAYGSIQLVSFAVRTITTMVMVKITFTKDFHATIGSPGPKDVTKADDQDSVTTWEDIPYMMSGLPGSSAVPVELLFSVIEISLAMCAFYLAWAVQKRDQQILFDQRFYYTAPIETAPGNYSLD